MNCNKLLCCWNETSDFSFIRCQKSFIILPNLCMLMWEYGGTGGLMGTLMLLSQRASEVAFHSIKSVCGCLATGGPVFQSGAVCSQPTIRQARGKTGGGEDERRKCTNWQNGRGGLEGPGSMVEQTACLSVCLPQSLSLN